MMRDPRHGGPYDRGRADAYYARPYAPHYFVADTYQSERIEGNQMTERQIADYTAGYTEQEHENEHAY